MAAPQTRAPSPSERERLAYTTEPAPVVPDDPDPEMYQGRERSSFPLGLAWEITPHAAERWHRHQFAHLRTNTNFLAGLRDFTRHELLELAHDILCWESLDPGTRKPLDVYLRPGREHWGSLGALLRLWRGMRDGTA